MPFIYKKNDNYHLLTGFQMKKTYFFWISFFIGISLIFAQANNDLKKNVIKKEHNHKENEKYYIDLTQQYLERHNLDSAGYFIQKALEKASVSHNPELLQKIYYLYGDISYYGNNYEKANDFYRKAQQMAMQNNDTIAYINLLIERAYIYDAWQKKDTLMSLVNEAMEISQQKNYYKGIGRSSMLIGSIYHGLGKHQEALIYYQKALNAAQQIPSVRGIGIAYTNIGMSYLELNQYDLAIENLIKSIPYLDKAKAYVQQGITYNDLAIIYSKTGDEQKTMDYLDKAEKITRKYGNDEDVAIVLNVKSECLSNLKYYRESNKYLDSCILLAKKIGFGLMLQKSYEAYADNLKQMHKYDQAYQYLKKHNQVKDSLLSLKYQKELAEFNIKFKTLEKQKRISELEHKRNLDKANFYTLLTGSMSLLLFVVIGGYTIIQKRRKQKEIAELELEKSIIKRKKLSQELELKNKQLTMHALNMMHKSTFINTIKVSLSELAKSVDGKAVKKIQSIRRTINNLLNSEKDWETFKVYFEQVNKEFITNLKNINNDLTQNDIRLATLMRLNMSNKEIASILNITYQSVKNAQYRLKNKLQLSGEEDLRSFIAKL